MNLTGAEEETRTLTPVRELDPEPSVSTNFTTSAAGMFLEHLPVLGKHFFAPVRIFLCQRADAGVFCLSSHLRPASIARDARA